MTNPLFLTRAASSKNHGRVLSFKELGVHISVVRYRTVATIVSRRCHQSGAVVRHTTPD
jgi:hypothetical protein